MSKICTVWTGWLAIIYFMIGPGFSVRYLTTRAWLSGSLVVSGIITLFYLCGEWDFMCVHVSVIGQLGVLFLRHPLLLCLIWQGLSLAWNFTR